MQQINHTLSRDRVVRELARHDINPTRQRVEIGMLLLGNHRHVTADQLLEEISLAGNTTVSKATVYNTLGLFARKGLLREVIIDPGRVVYDTNVSMHHHLFNVETGELQDVPSEAIQFSGLPQLVDGLVVDGVDVIIRVRPAH